MANWTLTDYKARLANLVIADTDALPDAKRTEAVQVAVELFSQAFPRILAAEIVGDGSYDYSLPTGWVDDFSEVQQIESPAGERPARYIEADEWNLYRSAAAVKLRFARALASGKSAVLAYSVLHEVTGSAGTISRAWNNAVSFLAASVACNIAASYYAQTGESSIGADAVAHRTKSQEYRALAGRWGDLYEAELEKAPVANSLQGDFDIPAPGGNRAPMFRRYGPRRDPS